MSLLSYLLLQRMYGGKKRVPVYEYHTLSVYDPSTLGEISAAKTIQDLDSAMLISLGPTALDGFTSIILRDMDRTQASVTEADCDSPFSELTLMGILTPVLL